MTRTLKDWTVGETFETGGRTITEALVDQFAGVTGDMNPLHTDHEAAAKGIFGRPVAHGLLVLGVVVGLWMRLPAFQGVGFQGIDGLRWLKPVAFGDTVTARMEVTAVEERGRYGLVVVRTTVLCGGATVLVFDGRLAVAS